MRAGKKLHGTVAMAEQTGSAASTEASRESWEEERLGETSVGKWMAGRGTWLHAEEQGTPWELRGWERRSAMEVGADRGARRGEQASADGSDRAGTSQAHGRSTARHWTRSELGAEQRAVRWELGRGRESP